MKAGEGSDDAGFPCKGGAKGELESWGFDEVPIVGGGDRVVASFFVVGVVYTGASMLSCLGHDDAPFTELASAVLFF